MNNITTAVILAAGLGSRFGKSTDSIPKGFIEYKNKAMVCRSIETLLECGIQKIIIGTGWKKEAYEDLKTEYPQIECVYSPRYAETNSMYTLYNCRNVIGDNDFLLLESDLVYEKRAIVELVDCEFKSAMLITPVTKFQDQYYVLMNDDMELVDCSTDKSQFSPSGELVGIHKINNTFYKAVVSSYEKILDEKPKLGYEYQLLYVSKNIMPMNVLKLDGLRWYEIDDPMDLAYAERNVGIE